MFRYTLLMNTNRLSFYQRFSTRLFVLLVVLCPALLQAHPGHYHPEETDEFDFLRTTFLHSHGAVDYLVAVVFLSSISCLIFSGKRSVQLAGLAAVIGSLVLLPLF